MASGRLQLRAAGLLNSERFKSMLRRERDAPTWEAETVLNAFPEAPQ